MSADTLPLHRLRLSELRPKTTKLADTPELRRQIQEHGIVDPIVVRPSPSDPAMFEVLSNVQNYIAAGKLAIDTVPVLVRDDLTEEECASIVFSSYGAQSNPMAEAEALQELLDQLDHDYPGQNNVARLSRQLGLSRSVVSRSLSFLSLPDEVQALLRDGKLKTTHARELLPVRSRQKQITLAQRAIEQSWSVTELKRRITRSGSKDTPVPSKCADTMRLEQHLTDHLGSPVDIDMETGKLTIAFFSNLETLDGILAKIGYQTDSEM